MNISEAHQILGLPISASREEIKKAYRRFAKQWHPDVNKSSEATEKFKQANAAYEVLMSEKSRIPISPIFDFSEIFGGIPRRDFGFSWDTFGGKASITLEIENLSQVDGEKIVNLIRNAGFNIKGYKVEIKN